MARILFAVVLGLIGLIAVNRLGSAHEAVQPAPVSAVAPQAPTPAPKPQPRRVDSRPAAVPDAFAESGTPTIDRLAMLESRRRILQARGITFIDSLIASTDSTLRRWPDRGGRALRVYLALSTLPEPLPTMPAVIRQALDQWEAAGVGLRFEVVPDSAGADIQVHWVASLDSARVGQADVQWGSDGLIRFSLVTLAMKTVRGDRLSADVLGTVATHEFGHALGLAHSGDGNDVMFGTTRVGRLSGRDRSTIALLYSLPPGSLRDRVAR